MQPAAPLNLDLLKSELYRLAPAFELRIDDGLADRVISYCRLLERWNRRISLVSFSSESELAQHHILESLYLQRFIDKGTTHVIDIGSGAGFLGVCVAMRMPETEVRLIESNRRKAVFLSEVVRELGLSNVKVFPERYQDLEAPSGSVATCRALEKLDLELANLVRRLAHADRFLFLVGEGSLGAAQAVEADCKVTTSRIPLSEARYLVQMDRQCST